MGAEDWIRERAEALKALSQWREPVEAVDGRESREGVGIEVDARSNDYLGLARQVVSRETVEGGIPAGAGTSRLISGTRGEHLELEAQLAAWLQVESTLLFSSGYAANLGVVSALAGPGDVVFSDALNHASLIDGCRLGRARVVVIRHLDLAALEQALGQATDAAGRWVVTESYFGMDGDVPDLRALRRLCDRYGAGLIVDEAHALGVFGAEGRGLCAEAGIAPDLLIAGMGKGLGAQGGFAAGSAGFRGWLWNRARSFVFSTAPSPVVCRVGLQQLRRLREADSLRQRLRELEARLERQLLREGVPIGPSRRGPVFPIVFGTERRTVDAAAALRAMGISSHPIRPPTVAAGTSRLRVTLRADMTDEQVERLGAGLAETWKAAFLSPAPAPPGAGGASSSAYENANESGAPASRNPPAVTWDGAPARPSAARHASVAAATVLDPARLVAARRSTSVSVRMTSSDASSTVGVPSSIQRLAHADDLAQIRSAPDDAASALPQPPVQPEATARAGSARVTPVAPPLPPRRWIVLGTGTDVGKSFVAEALVRLLARSGHPVAGVKPVETGLAGSGDAPPPGDAVRLQQASFHVKHPMPHPLFAFPDPLAPSLAARRAARQVDLGRVPPWLDQIRADGTSGQPALVIETAGGVFSPLNDSQDNLDLAVALGPAEWILVAPDRLGTLHDVLSTLRAMESVQRAPDWLILSAVRDPDASSGTNAAELRRRNIKPRIISLDRNETAPLEVILERDSPIQQREKSPAR